MLQEKERHMMRERLFIRCGMKGDGSTYSTNTIPDTQLDLDKLSQSEWCPEFETLMRNRLLLGSLRYGLMGMPGKPIYDRVNCMKNRLDKYRKTGNLEYLVDIANLTMLEYVEGKHPLKHFKSIDADDNDTDHHTKIIK